MQKVGCWLLLIALWAAPPALRAAPEAKEPYHCFRVADAEVTVDGEAKEAVWQRLPVIELVCIKDGAKPAVRSQYRVAWSETSLYVLADLEDRDVVATIKEHDGNLWKEDAIELFINPEPANLLPYFEFEVSPLGTSYDTLVYHPRKTLSATYEQPWKHNYEPPGVVVKTVQTVGDQPGWRVEMKIPLAAVTLTQELPLRAGQRWRVGVFRIDQHAGEQRDEYSWQMVPDGRFHAPESFGTFRFEGPKQ